MGEAALRQVEAGFTAVKMNATEEMHYIDSFAKVEQAAARIAAVREAVGKEVGIGIDFHGRVHKSMAKILVKELEPTGRCLSKNLYCPRIMKRWQK